MKTSNKQGSNLTNIIIESNSYTLNKKLTLHNSQYSFTVVITHDQNKKNKSHQFYSSYIFFIKRLILRKL